MKKVHNLLFFCHSSSNWIERPTCNRKRVGSSPTYGFIISIINMLSQYVRMVRSQSAKLVFVGSIPTADLSHGNIGVSSCIQQNMDWICWGTGASPVCYLCRFLPTYMYFKQKNSLLICFLWFVLSIPPPLLGVLFLKNFIYYVI